MPGVKESRSSIADLRSLNCCFFGKRIAKTLFLCQLYLASSVAMVTIGGFGFNSFGGLFDTLLNLFIFFNLC